MKLVNLLPKRKQQELRFERFYRACLTFLGLSWAVYLFAFAGQYATKLYLGSVEKDLVAQNSNLRRQVDKQDNASVKQQVKELNGFITDYQQLASTTPRWSKVLRAFSELPPDGVQVTSVTADVGRRTVSIRGFAPEREQVIEFYNRIRADADHFEAVDYPLENVERPRNVSFHFSFVVKDSVLR